MQNEFLVRSKYFPATNTKGSRYKVERVQDRPLPVYVQFDYAAPDAALAAVQATYPDRNVRKVGGDSNNDFFLVEATN